MILAASGTLDSFVRLITSIIIFVFVLAITFWTSRFIGKFQKQSMSSGNVEVMESTRIAPNQYLQIVRVGERFFLLAVGKESTVAVTELNPEQMDLNGKNTDPLQAFDFSTILEKAKNSRKKQANTDE